MKISALSGFLVACAFAAAMIVYVDAQSAGTAGAGQTTPTTAGQTSIPGQPKPGTQPVPPGQAGTPQPQPGQPTTPGTPTSPGQPSTPGHTSMPGEPGTPGPAPAPGSTMSAQRTQSVMLQGCVEPFGIGAAGAQPSFQLTHIQPSGTAASTVGGGVAGTSQPTQPSIGTSTSSSPSSIGGASAAGTPPSAYQLAAGQGIDLSGHVGQRVQVIGTMAAPSGTATTATSVGTAGTMSSPSSTTTTMPGSVSGSATTGQAPLSTFNVTSVQAVGASCQ